MVLLCWLDTQSVLGEVLAHNIRCAWLLLFFAMGFWNQILYGQYCSWSLIKHLLGEADLSITGSNISIFSFMSVHNKVMLDLFFFFNHILDNKIICKLD